NHTSAIGIRTQRGRVREVILRDRFSGTEYAVTATHVINATGPWADMVCGASGVNTRGRMIGGVRGSHIVLSRFPGAPTSAVYTVAHDGRPVFMVPWNGQLLFGTTEVRDDGDPERVRPSDDEITYLLDSLRRMWPQAEAAEISYTFSGVRPLPRADGVTASAITRRHLLRDHTSDGAQGLISVIGGKLTTAAALARECARKIGLSVPEPAVVHGFVDGSGVDALLDQFADDVSRIAQLDHRQARALVHWHGGEAIHVARTIAEDARRRKPIVHGTHHLVGEALFAVTCEAAVTLADILLRRVPLALEPDWSELRTREAARNIGALLVWTEHRIQMEAERFEEERSAFLVRPAAGRIAA
ncbi:MAG: FAD-dependent oxidoreductase, partial [Terriglobales bacterium]